MRVKRDHERKRTTMAKKPTKQPETNAVAATTAQALTRANMDKSTLDAYGIVDGKAMGTEDIGANEIIVPRVRLVQSMSDEAQLPPDDPGFLPMGTMVRSDDGTVLRAYNADHPLIVLPLMRRMERIRFKDNAILWRSEDAINHSEMSAEPAPEGATECAKCSASQWTRDPENEKKRKPPICSLQYVFPSLLVDTLLETGNPMEALIIVIFTKTSEQIGRKLVSQTRLSGFPFFAFPLALTHDFEVNDQNKRYAVWKSERRTRLDPSDPLLAAGKNMFEMLNGVTITTHVDATINEDGASGEGTGGSAPASGPSADGSGSTSEIF